MDEIALVMLISTGADKALAEVALRATAGHGTNAFEAALDWLTSTTAALRGVSAGNTAQHEVGEAGMDDNTMEASGSSGGSSSSADQEEARHQAAFELFERELGEGLQRADLAEEHLALPLHDEMALIDKYLALALSQASSP